MYVPLQDIYITHSKPHCRYLLHHKIVILFISVLSSVSFLSLKEVLYNLLDSLFRGVVIITKVLPGVRFCDSMVTRHGESAVVCHCLSSDWDHKHVI